MSKKPAGLKIMIYDNTCTGKKYIPGLTHSWIAGGLMCSALGIFDTWKGFSTWDHALRFLASVGGERPISEIQFWGHGRWGMVLIDGQPLDITAFEPSSSYFSLLTKIAERLTPDALLWFRTCETFGGTIGHQFALASSRFFNCRIAGHTYIIGPWQAGLYAIQPDQAPYWPADDGLLCGTSDNPERAKFSQPWHPRAISCMRMSLPDWAAQAHA